MFAKRAMILLAGLLALPLPNHARSAETVGQAVLIRTTVTGDGRTMVTRSPVFRDERIRTSGTGLGEFIFRDGTKFAVGRNSSIVVDRFVFADDDSFRNLTVKAAKGSFRWISGGSKSSAYRIDTPAGTIGVRGTALDIFIGDGGVTAVVLLSGAARFCGRNGCKELRRTCDYVIATPRRGITEPERANAGVLRRLGTSRAFPFMTGEQRLSRRFHAGTRCSLASAELRDRTDTTPVKRDASPRSNGGPTASPGPGPSNPPGPDPDPPSEPDSGKNGNNGKGNGGGDGSPNGKEDVTR